MPRVCADPCAFTVDAGSLGLNWEAVGSTFAFSQSGFIDMGVTGTTEGFVGPYGLQRLSYTNNTCVPRVVRYEAYVNRVDVQQPAGTRYLTALGINHQFDTPPPDSMFDVSDAAVLRVNHPFEAAGLERHTSPLVSRAVRQIVDPGRTLHMSAALWKWIFVYAASPENQLTAGYVVLQYQSWPLGM